MAVATQQNGDNLTLSHIRTHEFQTIMHSVVLSYTLINIDCTHTRQCYFINTRQSWGCDVPSAIEATLLGEHGYELHINSPGLEPKPSPSKAHKNISIRKRTPPKKTAFSGVTWYAYWQIQAFCEDIFFLWTGLYCCFHSQLHMYLSIISPLSYAHPKHVARIISFEQADSEM